MATRPRGKKTPQPPDDPYAQPLQNPGGPVTEEDCAAARALLGAGLASVDDSRMSDHTGPGYDPNRIVRILTALREILPKEIGSWKYGRLSRAEAEKMWVRHLFSEDCNTCEQRCAGCRELAEALGYERVEDNNGRRTWRSTRKKTAR